MSAAGILAVLVPRPQESFWIDRRVIRPGKPVEIVPPIVNLRFAVDVRCTTPGCGWRHLARLQVFPCPFDEPSGNAPEPASRDLDLAGLRPHPDDLAHNGHVVMSGLDGHVHDADLFRPFRLAVSEHLRQRLHLSVTRHDVVVPLGHTPHFLPSAALVRLTPTAIVSHDLGDHFVSEHVHAGTPGWIPSPKCSLTLS